jgi:xanthine/uracil permease
MERSLGPLIIGIGLVVVVIGLLVFSGALSWFGRLPGDVRIRSDHTRVYIPIVSCLLASLVLSLVLAVVRRFF